MRHLLIGIAAVAMSASMVHANPGNGNGNGKGKPAAAAKATGGPAKAAQRANRGNGNTAAVRGQRGNGQAKANRPQVREAGGNGNPNRGQVSRAARDVERAVDRRIDRRTDRRIERRVDRRIDRTVDRVIDSRFSRPTRLIAGCPPGLAKKNNGCQPPGQAKRNRYRYSPNYFGYNDRYDGRFYYRDGYLLQSTGSGIGGWLPLLGGALSIGNAWPQNYKSGYLPDYYESYYDLGPRSSYRYADRVAYRVDPDTAAITSVAALLTGDDFTVGQPVPTGYDVYNVPYEYRDRYYDRPDRYYRYSDGYIYEVDPETRLVAAAIKLLV